MDPIGLSNDSELRNGPSEESPTEDNPTNGSDWSGRFFRLVWRGVRLVSCQTNLIGRAARLLFLVNATWLVRPINYPVMGDFDRPVRLTCPWQTLLIGCFAWLAPHVFYGILGHAMSDMQTSWQIKRLREGVFFAVTNTRQYAGLTCLWRLNR